MTNTKFIYRIEHKVNKNGPCVNRSSLCFFGLMPTPLYDRKLNHRMSRSEKVGCVNIAQLRLWFKDDSDIKQLLNTHYYLKRILVSKPLVGELQVVFKTRNIIREEILTIESII